MFYFILIVHIHSYRIKNQVQSIVLRHCHWLPAAVLYTIWAGKACGFERCEHYSTTSCSVHRDGKRFSQDFNLLKNQYKKIEETRLTYRSFPVHRTRENAL